MTDEVFYNLFITKTDNNLTKEWYDMFYDDVIGYILEPITA